MKKAEKTERTERIALFPGSFDPFTEGHLDVVRRAAEIFDRVIVAVMVSETKKALFCFEDRLDFIRTACEGIPNVSAVSSRGYTVDLARELGVCAMVRGVRNESDLGYEFTVADFNRDRAPEILTMLIPCPPELKDVSSTEVRRRLSLGLPLDGTMPDAEAALVLERYAKKAGLPQ